MGYNNVTLERTAITSEEIFKAINDQTSDQNLTTEHRNIGNIIANGMPIQMTAWTSGSTSTIYKRNTSNFLGYSTNSTLSTSNDGYISVPGNAYYNIYIELSKTIKLKRFKTFCSYSTIILTFFKNNEVVYQDVNIGTVDKNLPDYIEFDKIGIGSSRSSAVNLCLSLLDTKTEITNYENNFSFNFDTSNIDDNKKYYIQTPEQFDLQGVTHNKLNGKTIKNILRPHSKYEIIYNQNDEEWETCIVGKTLLDITLSTGASEIKTGLKWSDFEVGKIYEILAKGIYGQYQEATILLKSEISGDGVVAGFLNQLDYRITTSLSHLSNDGRYIGTYGRYTSNTVDRDFADLNNKQSENITIKNGVTNYTFQAGTRFIIREVA